VFDETGPVATHESPGEPAGAGDLGPVVVRRFAPADLERITRIEDASFPVDAFEESEFRRLATAYPDEFLVAEISGNVVGYVAGSVTADCGEIESLAVDQGVRGRGVGERLITSLLDRFQRAGLGRCALEVRTTNAVAIDLYERLGFHIVRTLDAYYADGGDAFLMEKALLPARATRDGGRVP
jgi:ribosomal-protein-alanine acetyltransferase